MTLAGWPPTNVPEGTSLVTTLLTATTELSPIETPGKITARSHIQTFDPIETGFIIASDCKRSFPIL